VPIPGKGHKNIGDSEQYNGFEHVALSADFSRDPILLLIVWFLR
jgi:hypothetical protein